MSLETVALRLQKLGVERFGKDAVDRFASGKTKDIKLDVAIALNEMAYELLGRDLLGLIEPVDRITELETTVENLATSLASKEKGNTYLRGYIDNLLKERDAAAGPAT